MLESGDDLRLLLRPPRSLAAVHRAARSGDLDRLLGTTVTEHVLAVYDRVERASAGEPERDATALKLVALVHEEPPERMPRLLAAADLAGEAPFATAIVAAFGALWRAQDEAELARLAERRAATLRPLLLFEVAHEGDATPAMRDAARLGGFAGDVDLWLARIRSEARRAAVNRGTPGPPGSSTPATTR